jgi:hypothetical protein
MWKVLERAHTIHPLSNAEFEHKIVPAIVVLVRFQKLRQMLGFPFLPYTCSPTSLAELPVCWKPARLMPVDDGEDAGNSFTF